MFCRKRRLSHRVEDDDNNTEQERPGDLPMLEDVVVEDIASPSFDLYVNGPQGPYDMIDPAHIQIPDLPPRQAIEKEVDHSKAQSKMVSTKHSGRKAPPVALPRPAKSCDYLVMDEEDEAPKPADSPYLLPRQHSVQTIV